MALRQLLLIFILLLVYPSLSQPLQFPRDEGKHKGVDFESWVVFSHVNTSDSSRFGIALFFFTGKVIGLKASGVFVVVADEKNQVYQNYKKIQYPIINRATHTRGRLYEKYGKNILERKTSDSPYLITIDMKELKLSLELNPLKGPVDLGQLPVGEERYNRFYAVPRGEVKVNMNYRGEDYSLEGIGIFQHQWGDSPQKDAASSLFALHFQNSWDVLVYYSDAFPTINMLVISRENGDTTLLKNFSARSDTVLTSASEPVRVAMAWEIESPQKNVRLRMMPTFDGQEINLLGLPYWLARCRVEGSAGDHSLNGKGYVFIRNWLSK